MFTASMSSSLKWRSSSPNSRSSSPRSMLHWVSLCGDTVCLPAALNFGAAFGHRRVAFSDLLHCQWPPCSSRLHTLPFLAFLLPSMASTLFLLGLDLTFILAMELTLALELILLAALFILILHPVLGSHFKLWLLTGAAKAVRAAGGQPEHHRVAGNHDNQRNDDEGHDTDNCVAGAGPQIMEQRALRSSKAALAQPWSEACSAG